MVVVTPMVVVGQNVGNKEVVELVPAWIVVVGPIDVVGHRVIIQKVVVG